MPERSESREAIRRFEAAPRPLPLRCGIQHYDWGGLEFIPELIGERNEARRPYAELWIGAHQDLPARVVIEDRELPLDRLVAATPETILGPQVARRFQGELPFLLKVLSARMPLSIQAHPSRRQAEQGFARENQMGIPLTAPSRNYRDPHHKPELIAAVTDFYALSGFRPLEEIAQVLDEVPEFQPLRRVFEPSREGLRTLYTHIMHMAQPQVDAILTPLVGRLREAGAPEDYGKDHIAHWVLRADEIFSRGGHRDRGLFSLYLLNRVHLRPGEALYAPAGRLHAYLEGNGIEVMANSNNVLRGGLTSKHVDVEALLGILDWDSAALEPVLSHGEGLAVFGTPAQEFELARLQLGPGRGYRPSATPSVVLGIVIEGAVSLGAGRIAALDLGRGRCFMVPGGVDWELSTVADAAIFLATVPNG
jgi:mannose-6-phosphate isomerase class I